MWRDREQGTGWQGASLVAITYVYFLIFAQFAFLHRLDALGITGTHLKAVMAAMALGGVGLSLLAPRTQRWASPRLRVRVGLAVCAAAAFLALLPLGTAAGFGVALLIGAGLGLLTVTLVTHLRQWSGSHPLFKVALGTGTGYLLCNIPPFFAASAQVHAVAAGLLCAAGIGIVPLDAAEQPAEAIAAPRRSLPFPLVVACFAALVWLDSAAFFIIQNTPLLKAGTWQGTAHLWVNAVLHWSAALASAWLLTRRGLGFVLSAAFVVLACACLLLLEPAHALPASVLYPVGVSLYSVALVAYPSLLAPAASAAERGRQAGWIYALAGWVASALGIGMGQNLGHVPPAFVACAGAVVLSPWLLGMLRERRREIALTAVLLCVGYAAYRAMPAAHSVAASTAVERGRQVYISEGCIHCHSQYVRPGTRDELLWGPAQSVAAVRSEQPPLIGNRRQGPDLAEVGVRRSPLWLKAHFYDPRQVSGASIMPSFAFLFRDERGADLVAYLASLQGPDAQKHITEEENWEPAPASWAQAGSVDGAQLYARFCATCHDADGRTRIQWKTSFKRLPPDLARGPYFYLPPAEMRNMRLVRLAQITRFGLPGTDMPGHEYLGDVQIASLSLWLMQRMDQPMSANRNPIHTGDRP